MRADRLLSILLLLQARGRVTAGDLAREMEVSERTIYRDINALGMAGVPVYGIAGPEGGYALVDNYRTQLTGLSQDEVRALFMLGSLAPLTDLGVSQELRAALRKLSAALPNIRLADQDKVQQFFYFDSSWWAQGTTQTPHLQEIHQAIWLDRKLYITYQTFHTGPITRLVAPYGLVVKAGNWFLVYANENEVLHVQRVSKLMEVHPSQEPFVRPADFDLVAFWEGWSKGYERSLTDFRVTVRAERNFIPVLNYYFGSAIQDQINQGQLKDKGDWIRFELAFESFDAARSRILGFGRGVEVLSPEALKLSVIDFAKQIAGVYEV